MNAIWTMSDESRDLIRSHIEEYQLSFIKSVFECFILFTDIRNPSIKAISIDQNQGFIVKPTVDRLVKFHIENKTLRIQSEIVGAFVTALSLFKISDEEVSNKLTKSIFNWVCDQSEAEKKFLLSILPEEYKTRFKAKELQI